VRDHPLSTKVCYKQTKRFLSTWKRIQPAVLRATNYNVLTVCIPYVVITIIYLCLIRETKGENI